MRHPAQDEPVHRDSAACKKRNRVAICWRQSSIIVLSEHVVFGVALYGLQTLLASVLELTCGR